MPHTNDQSTPNASVLHTSKWSVITHGPHLGGAPEAEAAHGLAEGDTMSLSFLISFPK
jgi:hypothetical protein